MRRAGASSGAGRLPTGALLASLFLLAPGLAGCVSAGGAVLLPGEKDPNPPAADAERQTQHYPPKVVERPAPPYPEAALASRVTCKARVTVEVDREGRPKLVGVEWLLPPPERFAESFEGSIEETIPLWVYLPAVHLERTRRPDGKHEYEGGYAGSRDQVLVTFHPRAPLGEALVHPLGEP